MGFAHDTEVALASTVWLVNTATSDGDQLVSTADVDAFVTANQFSGPVEHTDAELAELRGLRTRLRGLWQVADRAEAAAIVNAILAEADARPFLARHDGLDWHLHVTELDAPLVHRVAAESAMAVLDLIREDELDRLRVCEADDCQSVFVDLSRNRSRRYCDGTCGNRANVTAYRARQRAL